MTDHALPAVRYVENRVLFANPMASLARLLALFVVAGFVLIPLLATVLGGVKTKGELRTNPFGLPEHWLLSNFTEVLTAPHTWQMLSNSLSVGAFTVLLTLAIAAPAAFAFAHLKFFGEQLLFNYL